METNIIFKSHSLVYTPLVYDQFTEQSSKNNEECFTFTCTHDQSFYSDDCKEHRVFVFVNDIPSSIAFTNKQQFCITTGRWYMCHMHTILGLHRDMFWTKVSNNNINKLNEARDLYIHSLNMKYPEYEGNAILYDVK